MTKRGIVSAFFMFIAFTIPLFANKNVLIINSYHKGFDWSDRVIEGIEKVFYNTKIDTNFLYMDSKRISSKEYYDKLRDLYKIQLLNRKYDLVLAIDKFSYEFVLQNYHELFKNEPIYFTGIEQFSKELVKKYNLENKVSGLLERRAIEENIKLIFKVMPDVKKLYIINDKSANGDDSEPFIQKAINKYSKNVKIKYIRKSTLLELKEKFSKKKNNEAVFFIRFYNDKYGKFYKNSEIASMIDSSKLPVFVTDTLFIGKGAIGGKLVLIKKLGEKTGQRVFSILKNEIKTPIVEVANDYDYIFDFKKIQEFSLHVNILDKKIRIINKPKTFFDKHRNFINFVFVISPFLLILIVGLIYNLYLRIKNEKLLKERMEFDKVLLNSIQSPIVWQDKNGQIVDSNLKFSNLMGMYHPNKKGQKLKNYISLDKGNPILKILNDFVDESNSNKELILKDYDNKEHIYLVNQTEYTENVYKSSGTVTIFTDITKEKLAQIEKKKNQEFIIQQSKLAELGEILSSIAHQWKAPLLEISTIAQEQYYANANSQNNLNFAEEIMVQVRYMTETINDFQRFIMPSYEKTVFDINEAVVKMMNIINHNIKYNYINVNIHKNDEKKLFVFGYKNELMQTLLNIVNNAKDTIIKSRKIDKTLKGNIDIYIKDNKNIVTIEIEDNAGGIEEKNKEKIFEPYFTTKEDGHGIGLYMAKLIIEDKMQGSLSVKNGKKGAIFCIKLELSSENISS
ncbi:ABC transporter substrate binding protein [Sulfurospirillum sp. 1307]|jgi:signal transduction histidine kinase/ABC-type uncharacterized transport system substrate-binding protein